MIRLNLNVIGRNLSLGLNGYSLDNPRRISISLFDGDKNGKFSLFLRTGKYGTDNRYLRADIDTVANGTLFLAKGAKSLLYKSGKEGYGYSIWEDSDSRTHLEIDHIHVRKTVEAENISGGGGTSLEKTDHAGELIRPATLVIPQKTPIGIKGEEVALYLGSGSFSESLNGGESGTLDTERMWEELASSNPEHVIDESHIPALQIGKISGLALAIEGKAAKVHYHKASDISDFQDNIEKKADKVHDHEGQTIRPKSLVVPVSVPDDLKSGETAIYFGKGDFAEMPDAGGIGIEDVTGLGDGWKDALSSGLPPQATRWPAWSEVTGKPKLSAKATTLPAGASATAAITEQSGVLKFEFGIPSGTTQGGGTSETTDHAGELIRPGTLVIPVEKPKGLNGDETGLWLGSGEYGEALPGQSGGFGEEEMWNELSATDETKKIDESHIPEIGMEKVTGLTESLKEKAGKSWVTSMGYLKSEALAEGWTVVLTQPVPVHLTRWPAWSEISDRPVVEAEAETLPAGSEATAGIEESEGKVILKLGIPKGADGTGGEGFGDVQNATLSEFTDTPSNCKPLTNASTVLQAFNRLAALVGNGNVRLLNVNQFLIVLIKPNEGTCLGIKLNTVTGGIYVPSSTSIPSTLFTQQASAVNSQINKLVFEPASIETPPKWTEKFSSGSAAITIRPGEKWYISGTPSSVTVACTSDEVKKFGRAYVIATCGMALSSPGWLKKGTGIAGIQYGTYLKDEYGMDYVHPGICQSGMKELYELDFYRMTSSSSQFYCLLKYTAMTDTGSY